MENWSRNIERFELLNNYALVKAKPEEFAVYESVYGDTIYNRFAVKHWDLRLEITQDNPFAEAESFYWIQAGDNRIGGVLIEPNVLARLFVIPPFADIFELVKSLKHLLIKLSDPYKNIYAYQVAHEQAHYFKMLGFRPDKSRRWMMRPTEIFNFTWDDAIIVKPPSGLETERIARLFYESFNGHIDHQYASKLNGQGCSYEDYLAEVNDYFNNCTEDLMLKASTLIYDKSEEKLVGACLVSSFEEWPLIHTIAVDPSYRGKGLATTMLKKGLTVLNKEYPVLRLFVTIGNVAESVYYELGFIQGVEFTKFYLAAK